MRRHALDVIREWPPESRKPASWLLHVHGEPDRVSDDELVWEGVEPWDRIVATRAFETRDWPEPHTASVRSRVRYRVPAESDGPIDELGLSLDIDRDAGLVTTVGPDLRTNLLTLNLMHDVVTGAVNPTEARRRYNASTTATPDGVPPDDMLRCRFDDLQTTEPDVVSPSDQPAGESTGGPDVAAPVT